MSDKTASADQIDVFVSHSSADQAWVQDQLVPRLEEAGLRVQVGYRDFVIGAPRTDNVEQAVRASRHTLIVLTPDWIEDEWTAFDSLVVSTIDPAARQRKLIPLMLKPCELPQRIQILTYADFTAPDQRALQWKRLIDALRPAHVRAAPSVPPPDVPQEPPQFIGREHELDLLDVERLAASRSPYLLLSAPSGYGKTSLLRQACSRIETHRVHRARWSVRYVELARAPQDPLLSLVQAITGDHAATIDQVCDHIVRELAAPLPEGRRAVLLIVDGVERLPQATQQWLYDLLCHLYRRTRVGAQEAVTVRVILAGHNVEQFWECYEGAHPQLPVPQRLDLGPLGPHAIQDWVWTQAKQVHTVLDGQTVQQIGDHVVHLSGGHPRAVRCLVADLAQRLFLIGPVAEYYAGRRQDLVRGCLMDVAAELLQDMAPGIRHAVQVLSVFRRINANTVHALVQAGVLPDGSDEIVLLGHLQRAHVLAGPSIAEPFYRDRHLRQVFALDLAHRSTASQARFRQLNELALALYVGWIQDAEPRLPDSFFKSAQRLFAAVEWLYHALHSTDQATEDLCAEFQALVAVLSQGSPAVPERIAAEIRQDGELSYMLRCRLGPEGVEVACSWLHQGLAKEKQHG